MLRHFAFVFFCLIAFRAFAEAVQTPHVEAELVAATDAIAPGEPLIVALRLKHEPEWHTYWKNPGDSGMPTRISWTLPDGLSASPISWPAPGSIPVGPLTNYGYDGEVLLLTEITSTKNTTLPSEVHIDAKAEWLVCKEICLPGGASLSLTLPSRLALKPSKWAASIEATRKTIPSALQDWRVTVAPDEKHIVISLVGKGTPELRALQFFPDEPEIIDHPSPQTLEKTADGYTLKLIAAPAFKGDIKTLSGVLVGVPSIDSTGRSAALVSATYPGGAPTIKAVPAVSTSGISASEIAGAANSASPTLWIALGLAFLGGIVLNLMPCVFPVISIKILGFAEEAHQSAARLRAYGIAFAAGVLICFWAVAGVLLALRASGQALGWGYQLQSPVMVTLLAVLFFGLALNLSGVFEFGQRVQSLAGNVAPTHGLRSAFVSGLIATLVATPCTAPFMGAALGYALTQSAWKAMLVFTMLALGMALPYVLLTFSPRMLRRLPRPGRWMETLKQLLAFPLYLTVVWLVWVLSEQLGALAGAKLMVGLVLLAAALWLKTRFFEQTGAKQMFRAIAAVASVALLIVAILVGWPRGEAVASSNKAATPSSHWKVYSEAALSEERAAHKAVFVDFTAAWCVTCQVNKRLVLESETVKQAFAQHAVTRLRADWTNRDEAIAAALARLGRSGVPVYAVYPADGGAPDLLPEILTTDAVVAALARAARR